MKKLFSSLQKKILNILREDIYNPLEMKVAFFGTPNFSANILKSLLTYPQIEIDLVVSQADKPVWRKQEIHPTPVKEVAQAHNIETLQPLKIKNNEDFITDLQSRNLDFIVVVAYGKIIPQAILDIPKYGCINIHWSLLPKYRWASPIQAAIRNGDTKTGITIMYMDAKMDEWDILQMQTVDIDSTNTTPDIFEKFQKISPLLLIDTLEKIVDNTLQWSPQNENEATYCSMISQEDAKIDRTQSAKKIYDTGRAYTPWPWIYTIYKGKKLKIEECSFDLKTPSESIWTITQVNKQIGIICWEWILFLEKVKLEGKKSMNIRDFINGNKDFLTTNLNN